MAADFIPGRELSRTFYWEVVRPLLDDALPGVPHSAALLGPGSEVLGFDTRRSTDHDWGPRLQVFLSADDAATHAADVTELLATRLPSTFRGIPTTFPPSGEHRVVVTGLASWFRASLGFDPRDGVTLSQWLGTPSQLLAEATCGEVFHDGLDELARVRTALAWYPHDVWLYVLACQWTRISQEEAFPGRCAEIGDDLGSVVLVARLARDLMRLCLLMHRQYPPYSKWLGTAFARLSTAATVGPPLSAALVAGSWETRERHLCAAYRAIAMLHNELGLTDPLDPDTSLYHTRPFQVLWAGRFANALLERIEDPRIRSLPPVGTVSQFMDSTDALGRRAVTDSAAGAVVRLAGD